MTILDDPLLANVPVVDGFKVIEPCVLYAPVGRGGMGSVYRGRHLNLELDVAVKCLKASLAAEDPDFVSRFQREARVAASVSDANLIRTYDVGKRHGVHYLVMEYVEGENLRDRVTRKGALALNEALTIAIAACKGVGAAHAAGVVHRDIKPGNILISRTGQVKVADLGLAKAADSADSLATATHVVLGTPQYMPPEQFQSAKNVGPTGDVYALAASLWFMVEGSDAVEAGALSEVMCRVVIDGFPAIETATSDIPPSVAAIIERATRKEPSERYRDATELGEALQSAARELGLTSSLADDRAGATRAAESMVSPPPVETFTRIQSLVASGAIDRSEAGSEAPTVRSPEADSPSDVDRTPSAISSRLRSMTSMSTRRLRRVALGIVVLGALGLAFCLFVHTGGRPDAGPRGAARNGPSSLVPAREVQFFVAVHDLRAAHGTAALFARNVNDLEGGRHGDVGSMMAEVTEDFFGIPAPGFDDFAAAGIDTGSGLCIATYWNGIEVAAFRTSDGGTFRRRLEEHWNDSGYVVETAVRRGFGVLQQKHADGGWTRRTVLIDGDDVYFTPNSDADELIAFLIDESESPLAKDAAFAGRTAALVADRDVTLYFDLPPREMAADADMREIIGGFRGFAASVREMDGAHDLEMRFDVDPASPLARLAGTGADSLLGYFETEGVLAALEVRLDAAEIMRRIDASPLGEELRQADREVREALGRGFRADVLDRLDGRVAWLVGPSASGRISAYPGGEARVETGRTRFPVRLDPEFRRYVEKGGRPLSLSLPGTTLAVGVKGDPAEVVRAVEELMAGAARDERDVAFTASSDAAARIFELSIRDEGVNFETEVTAHEDFITLGPRGATATVVGRPFGAGTFGTAPGALMRGWLDSSAVGAWLMPVANDPGVEAVFRRLSDADPLALELVAGEDGLVATARLGTPHPFRTVRHPFWAVLFGIVTLIGGGLVCMSRRP